MTALAGRAFVLLYGPLRTGGIETLMLRVSRWLAERGAPVTICCQPGGALERAVDARVRVVHFARTRDLVRAAGDVADADASRTLLLSFDPISAARGLRLAGALRAAGADVRHVSGVFHPQAYFMPGERADRVALNRLVARAVGHDALFFMNAECRDSHAARWRTDLSRAPVLALPIDAVPFTPVPAPTDALRVLSIGRLVPFKAYNLGAPEVVRACADAGVRVEWDIHGEGELAEPLRARAEALGVSSQIRRCGELPYDALTGAFAGYDAFVGMGTAALQAAMAGLPTICATVDRATTSHGTLDALPFGNVGEPIPGGPVHDIAVLLIDLARADRAARDALSRRCRAAAERYATDTFVEGLLARADAAAPPDARAARVGALYDVATDSPLTALGRAALRRVLRPGHAARDGTTSNRALSRRNGRSSTA